jgi:hypothetical protein
MRMRKLVYLGSLLAVLPLAYAQDDASPKASVPPVPLPSRALPGPAPLRAAPSAQASTPLRRLRFQGLPDHRIKMSIDGRSEMVVEGLPNGRVRVTGSDGIAHEARDLVFMELPNGQVQVDFVHEVGRRY